MSRRVLEELRIDARFCGPPASGNGGYVCGRVARHLVGDAAVRLFVPPPLDTPLEMVSDDGVVRLMAGEQRVAEGRAMPLELEVPPAPGAAAAREAATRYAGFEQHSFPTCFVCGPERPVGDGLRIFAGPLPGGSPVAAPWIPDDSLAVNGRIAPVYLWAALDCPGAFSVLPAPPGKALVLGELHAHIEAVPAPGDHCIASGWAIDVDGRKHHVGSAVYGADGACLAHARATWIEVDEAAFRPDGTLATG
ncbi:MAG: hypothetical protein R3233_01485 [Xanthomonadales bacterium]|nr:hypothetical protein [Xanthomonadales bacterium]